jgi:hypothetical protein
MREAAACFHNLEWPPEGARLAGPIAWLRGWIVGKPGHDFTDVRVRHAGGTHLGVLGLPRTDLAAHFRPDQSWLPAEFILGVPVTDGPVTLTVEARDALGAWHPLPPVNLTIAPDGQPPPRVEGRVEIVPTGSWTVRDAHHPFHGHLDEPGPAPRPGDGRARVFGWLLDETQPLTSVLATLDLLVFNALDHSRTDEALAPKVRHPGARHARLRGAVDCPVSLPAVPCLRVYAVSPGGAVHLCFAQRIQPVTAPETLRPAPELVALPQRPLPVLPSGRPRRLLFVVRSLWPNDATLRALDLARHLVGSHRWAARVVSTEDGPLRAEFAATDVESLVVDPASWLAAGDAPAADRALAGLQRQIWWKHLDAVAVFDPLCGWALALARSQGIPTVFDCAATEPLEPDPTGIATVQAALRASWASAGVTCFSSSAAASAQAGRAGRGPTVIIPQWHTPGLVPGAAIRDPRVALAPRRTADWLARQHPAAASRWILRQGPAGIVDADKLAALEDATASRGFLRTKDWSVDGVSLCLGPLFGRGPLRPVLDAAAIAIPVVAPRTPLTEEWFAGTRVPLTDPADPVALAHALLAWEGAPQSFQREADAIAPVFRAAHDPVTLLAQWEEMVGSVVRVVIG